MGEFPSRANQFKPGNRAAAGRPKYRDRAEQQLDELLSEDVDGNTMGWAIVDRLLKDAAEGKPYALKLALDRILPVVQEHEHRFPDPVGLADLETALDSLPSGTGTNGAAHGANGSGTNGHGGGAA